MGVVFRQIRAKNFRGFSDTGSLDLAEINVFLGPNSSGKSTLLYIPLLLKQTFEDPNPENQLLTDSRILELGSFADVVFAHDTKRSITIEVTFDDDALQGLPTFAARRKEPRPEDFIPNRFSLDFGATPRTSRIYVKAFSIYRRDGEMVLSGSSSSSGEIKHWETAHGNGKRGMSLNFYHFLPMIWPTGKARQQPLPANMAFLFQGLYGLRELCDRVFPAMIHLEPIRTAIRQVYRVTGESPTTVGPTGENLLGVLYRDEKRRKTTRRNLLKNLNYWLDEKFGLVKGVDLEPLTKAKSLYALAGRDTKTGTTVNLSAAGFGVSQVAPIIVQGFLSRPSACILIEQPEIHLHPSAQADLGDLFIEFAKQGKQLFVETHSQYILLRLLRRIAEKKLDPSSLRVFFVSRGENGSKAEPLILDDRGIVSNWPPGFFEEAYRETSATAGALVHA